MRACDQSSIFSTGVKFRPDYGILLELHALTLVARSYALLLPFGQLVLQIYIWLCTLLLQLASREVRNLCSRICGRPSLILTVFLATDEITPQLSDYFPLPTGHFKTRQRWARHRRNLSDVIKQIHVYCFWTIGSTFSTLADAILLNVYHTIIHKLKSKIKNELSLSILMRV